MNMRRRFEEAEPSVRHGLRTLPAQALILVARFWQSGPSRLLPPSCRFTPSCSAYAIEALGRYGAVRGAWLSARRLLRCHPWGGCGFDPVPAKDFE